MRVIAGSAKSLSLRYPKGIRIRPTTDAVRESLFASLGDRIVGARFADLYAGCGSVGIEALSRGAGECVFVEKGPRCLKALAVNLENTHLSGRATIQRGAVERVWHQVCEAHGPFDIVFADPPYDLGSFEDVARRLIVDWEGVADGGLVVVQCCSRHEASGLPPTAQTKRFGDTEIRFYERC